MSYDIHSFIHQVNWHQINIYAYYANSLMNIIHQKSFFCVFTQMLEKTSTF